MPVPSALACVRCSARYPTDHYAQDCPDCRARGAPANLGVVYDCVPGLATDRESIRRDRRSMWRWEGFLHASAAEAVTAEITSAVPFAASAALAATRTPISFAFAIIAGAVSGFASLRSQIAIATWSFARSCRLKSWP